MISHKKTVVGGLSGIIEKHLPHVDRLEIAWYGDDPIESIAVECTRCGETILVLYNKKEKMETN